MAYVGTHMHGSIRALRPGGKTLQHSWGTDPFRSEKRGLRMPGRGHSRILIMIRAAHDDWQRGELETNSCRIGAHLEETMVKNNLLVRCIRNPRGNAYTLVHEELKWLLRHFSQTSGGPDADCDCPYALPHRCHTSVDKPCYPSIQLR